jgi:hypothetical protein
MNHVKQKAISDDSKNCNWNENESFDENFVGWKNVPNLSGEIDVAEVDLAMKIYFKCFSTFSLNISHQNHHQNLPYFPT